ncbi:hypothetical protein [Polynucleobacter sp. UB-Piko-W3]|uniref:hypothetical protein n=1 Tax=Polynucleobacter sp. UB-Piko-W3 TaxID=1819735 RepID=UPI001C0BBADD|nr:hypothetical protein [Polynucleobacter sp. UB-Piko-W3]MBU3554736.1 hypothetical protein [Polynucleobacter sp. UB-Piko-W3]
MNKNIIGRWMVDASINKKEVSDGDTTFIFIRGVSVDEYFADGSFNSEGKLRMVIKNDFNYIDALVNIFEASEWKIIDNTCFSKRLTIKTNIESLFVDEEKVDDNDAKDEIIGNPLKDIFKIGETKKSEVVEASDSRLILVEELSDGSELVVHGVKTKKQFAGLKIDI